MLGQDSAAINVNWSGDLIQLWSGLPLQHKREEGCSLSDFAPATVDCCDQAHADSFECPKALEILRPKINLRRRPFAELQAGEAGV